MVTDSFILLASETPVSVSDCGIFQLVESNVKLAGETVTAEVSLEVKFTVLDTIGLAENTTDTSKLPSSGTEVEPKNTGFKLLISIAVILTELDSIPIPVESTETISSVVFKSLIPFTVTYFGIFQSAAVNVRDATLKVSEEVLEDTKFTVLDTNGFPDSTTDTTAVPCSVTVVAPPNTAWILFISFVVTTTVFEVIPVPEAVIVTDSLTEFASAIPLMVTY
jgi:hypothetical protein